MDQPPIIVSVLFAAVMLGAFLATLALAFAGVLLMFKDQTLPNDGGGWNTPEDESPEPWNPTGGQETDKEEDLVLV
jgi:hypothetical protein